MCTLQKICRRDICVPCRKYVEEIYMYPAARIEVFFKIKTLAETRRKYVMQTWCASRQSYFFENILERIISGKIADILLRSHFRQNYRYTLEKVISGKIADIYQQKYYLRKVCFCFSSTRKSARASTPACVTGFTHLPLLVYQISKIRRISSSVYKNAKTARNGR